nr:11350_t:CDS:1 [Entrophospora candida]
MSIFGRELVKLLRCFKNNYCKNNNNKYYNYYQSVKLSSSFSQQQQSSPQNSHFEIERKFTFDLERIPILESNKGPIKFQSIKFLYSKSFTDVYYDDDDKNYPLSTQDIWLRERDGKWECKTPMNLTPSMDSYHELVTHQEIDKYLNKKLTPSSSSNDDDFSSRISFKNRIINRYGLNEFCRITTTRKHYFVDEEFTLDLDTTDFGHHIGELELVVGNEEDVPKAEFRIAQFLKKHDWFFDTTSEVVMGKLTAYIMKFNRKQWKCMEKSGILKKKLFPESMDDVVNKGTN